MTADLPTILACLGAYAGLVLAVGIWAGRRSARTPEEYFLADRGLGTLVLFMALFGTNCTTFVLVGVPGQAYHDGIGIFGVNAPIVALGIPLTFWIIGSPARRMARRLGALTPAELYAKRFGSRALGWLLFFVLTAYTLPYMVIAVRGTAVTLHTISGEAIAPWMGGLGVLALTVVYTTFGGMRSTAWTNVLQGAIFLSFMVGAFFLIPRSMGGLTAAMESVRDVDPDLLRVEHGRFFEPRVWTSWSLVISLTVIGFPHMFVRLLAARDEGSIRGACRTYPIALAALWIPAVMIGVWGAAAFPGLEGRESDRLFSLMTAEHLPAWMGPLGIVVVLAAVMSTLDAQILTLSSMLVRDVLDTIVPERSWSDVAAGRAFGVAVAAAVFGLAQVWEESLYEMASLAFSGYTTLAPTLLLGVRWRRFTAPGAAASIVAGNAVLFLGEGGYLPVFGFLPVFWALLAATAFGVVGSLVTPAPSDDRTAGAFGEPAR